MCKIVQCSIIYMAAALVLASCASAGDAQQVPTVASGAWQPVDATTGQIADVDGLETLADAFPNSSSVRLRLLNAYIAAEQFERALIVAEQLAGEGYAFSAGAREFLAGLVGEEATPVWLAANEQNSAPLTASEVVATIPQQALLPEDVAVLGEGSYAVTTVVSRRVWFSNGQGWFPSGPLGSGNLSGIVADGSGMVVGSGDLGMIVEGGESFGGLIAMENGNDPLNITAPEGVQLSDIAFFSDQVIYASDPIGGGVYKSEGMGDGIEVLVAPGTFRSPQGIAPSEDGERLYISDYRYGLGMIDTATGAVTRLSADEPMLLDGIDGLWLYDDELIAVQNGLNPMRIVALTLSPDGNRITAMRVLEQANPEWTEPLGGDIFEDALYYIGNGSWDLFDEGGTLKEGAELRATHIRRLDLAEKPTD